MSLILRLFSCVCFSLGLIAVKAQTKGLLIEKSLDIKIPFTITQFSTKNGLPQSRVIDIVSKENGNLIILTANGIVEYNGSEFISFIHDDAYKAFYYSKLIWHENSGRLFGISSTGGLKLIYPEFKHLNEFIAADLHQDTLYCMNGIGEIYLADPAKLKFKKRHSSFVKNAQCVLFDSASFLIGSDKGLYRYTISSMNTSHLQDGNFSELKQNSFNGCIYALAKKEVFKVSGQHLLRVLDLSTLDHPVLIYNMAFTDEEISYVTTTDGLYEVSNTYTDHYTKKSALPSNFLQALYYNSKENCLFIGTGEKGLLKLQFKNCFTFTSSQGFAEVSSLSSIIKSKSGKILVANNQGGVYQIRIDTVLKLFELNSGSTSLAEIEGSIYVGTGQNGIMVVNGNTVTDTINFPTQLPNNHVHGVFKDSRGNIWIATDKGIARGTDKKNIKPFLTKDINQVVICFYELKNKNICVGASDGVYIIDKHYKIQTHVGKKQGLEGKEVRSFYEDSEGKLWIGTYDGGLYCYFKNKLTNINSLKNAMLSKDAFCLGKDQFGYLYITSNQGLWRIEEKKLSDFYEGKLAYLIPFYYGEENGIVNTEFNGGFQNNYLKTRMNHFYFPSIEGVVIVDPEKPSFRKLLSKINKMYVNDTLHDFKMKLLNDKTFSVAFDFSCLSYLNKYNIYFQYKLESHKRSEWSALQKNASVAFKMLPAGQYTFTLRALDAFNDDQPLEVSYAFSIDPVFYDTLWFKVLAFLTLLICASIIIRLRITHFRKQAIEKERVRRQLAEFELKATHAQMNPHFIFNSLNSIKYYLSINDQKNADNYIDHFSSLLRSFLENGSKDFIELKEELKILTSYLELEKQRMIPAFTYSIDLEAALEHQEIPTHLLQPFVENAIKHGINHSEKKCHLTLRFFQKEDYLFCTIDDNGIGREKSQRINKERLDHTSKGLEMVKEKIRIVKEIYNLEILLNIEDKVDKNNTPTGTFVEIKIPITQHENSHR